MADEKVIVELTPDEALVVFEFLSRYSEQHTLQIVDQSEQRVLWNMQCLLEKVLVAPLRSDYRDLLATVRAHLRDDL